MATISNDQALARYIALRDALTAAFDGAMEIAEMRRIARAQHAVVDEILRLNGLALADLAKAYAPALTDLQTAIDDLQAIKAEIKRISSSIATIAAVISTIAKILPLLGV